MTMYVCMKRNDHNYCGIYNVIKNDWKFEQYLTDLNFSQRVVMCKFQCCSNYLRISQSRFISSWMLIGKLAVKYRLYFILFVFMK